MELAYVEATSSEDAKGRAVKHGRLRDRLKRRSQNVLATGESATVHRPTYTNMRHELNLKVTGSYEQYLVWQINGLQES